LLSVSALLQNTQASVLFVGVLTQSTTTAPSGFSVDILLHTLRNHLGPDLQKIFKMILR